MISLVSIKQHLHEYKKNINTFFREIAAIGFYLHVMIKTIKKVEYCGVFVNNFYVKSHSYVKDVVNFSRFREYNSLAAAHTRSINFDAK